MGEACTHEPWWHGLFVQVTLTLTPRKLLRRAGQGLWAVTSTFSDGFYPKALSARLCTSCVSA